LRLLRGGDGNKASAARPGISRILGELALIFLGITAALWFDNANQARKQQQLETQILHEMSAGLVRDTADLHVNLVLGDSALASLDTVLARLAGSAEYSGELAVHFGWSSRFFRFFNNPAAYEHLRSAGLDVISNDTLRQSVISYYDSWVPTLRWVEETVMLRNWESYLLPHMMTKFEFEGPWMPAVPRDYTALRADVEYQNALKVTATLIRNQLGLTSRTLEEAERLIADIGGELRDR